MSAPHLRTFIAIHPIQRILDNVTNVQRELKTALAANEIRWVDPKQIHLTLKFLGNVPAGSIGEIEQAIRSACAGIPAFTLSAEGLGVFPDERRPQVLWAGLGGDVGMCQQLQRNIEHQTARWSQPESKPFHPHLTLARLKDLRPNNARELASRLHSYAAAHFGSWMVNSVWLMESKLSSAGAEHFPLAQITLGSQSCAL